jgi:hypothetical protein
MKKVILLLLTISLLSCSKDGNSDSSSEDQTNAIAYFKASLNGQQLDYVQDSSTSPSHFYSYSSGFLGLGFSKAYYYGCDLQPYTQGSFNRYPQIGLTYNSLYTTEDSSTENGAFYGLFNSLPTNFITSQQDSDRVKGISVSYASPNNVRYSTMNGSQSGSTINITSSLSGNEKDTNFKIQTLVGTVTCKLYNENDASDVISLTNGKFKLVLREFD